MRIGYLINYYPHLTTTFIYREVQALEALGFKIDVFSIWTPDTSALSPESRNLVDSTFYLFPVSWVKVFKTHFRFLIKKPALYLKTLFNLLTVPGESLKNRKRTLGHFLEAVCFSEEISRRGITHIHAHFAAGATSNAMIIARLLSLTFSFTAHNTYFTDRILIREKTREALFISIISEFSKNYLLNFVPGENLGGKCHIVRCGVATQAIPSMEKANRRKPPFILFVAQLAERKGALYLVKACEILAARDVRFSCIIAGDGPEREKLEKMVSETDIDKLVSFPGALYQEEVKKLLQTADIFALPCITSEDGDMDGIPVALMEAMVMGIPVVSTHVSGIPELIRDGVSGLLVEEKDATALADSLQRLLENKELARETGENARKKITAEFDLGTNAARLASLFENYLQ